MGWQNEKLQLDNSVSLKKTFYKQKNILKLLFIIYSSIIYMKFQLQASLNYKILKKLVDYRKKIYSCVIDSPS